MAGDTRLGKQRLAQCEQEGMCMTGAETTVHVPPPHYYDVRNADPEVHHQKSSFTWTVDPNSDGPVSDVANVDIKRGSTDDNTPFDWVSDLQQDMWDFGYRAHMADKAGRGAIPAACEPTGVFDDRLERVIRRFQIHARLPARMSRGSNPMSVAKTYAGEVTGEVDDDTKREIALWIDEGYRRILRPFDPEGIFAADNAARKICPEFYTLITGPLQIAANAQDIELYGPADTSLDKDSHRPTHKYGYTWHLVGLAMDVNCYSTKAGGEAKPWYYPMGRPWPTAGEYDEWPRWEWDRYWDMVRNAGLEISDPPSKDPRHVEFHPLVGTNGLVWNRVPNSIRAFISHTRDENSAADIRRAWGIAVDPKYSISEYAPATSPRPQRRPPNLTDD